MDGGDSPLFLGLKQRLSWLARRQEVLAKNIANADTPGYKPSDLKPQAFDDALKSALKPIRPAATDPDHLRGGSSLASEPRVITQRKAYETTPTGNAVVLEEQMAKVNETTLSHRLTTELYGKHLNMVKIAIGRGR
jgi:flagellar basal-body rod protein FlgB